MKTFWIAALALAALICGYFAGSRQSPPRQHAQGGPVASDWICSMHPQIRQPGPGDCPICGMDLIPESSGASGSGHGPELVLSEAARRMAGIETAAVERRPVSRRMRMLGRVAYHEPGLRWISARVGGRLDRLYVDSTGIPVSEGDHLVDIYSPELLQAQKELSSALDGLAGSQETQREFRQDNLESVREKLRRWGLGESQIARMERSGEPMEHVTLHSPVSGVVVEKNAIEGMYVEIGTNIYQIADLSKVWILFDAYESDLPWLRYGQEVEFRTDAHPGRLFRGRISFLDPVLDTRTRTLKARVSMANPEGLLRPDMLVRGEVLARLGEGGESQGAGLSGKWISPMHPEVVKEGPGVCDYCGMALVPAESLGYVDGEPEDAPLVIPASAPLITGRRAVVYVETGPGEYQGRQVELGPRADQHYLVHSGLEEGERVVVRGNFRIDSALQIQARPSMMDPPAPPLGADAWESLLSLYLETQAELAADSFALGPRWRELEGLPPRWEALAGAMASDGPEAAREPFSRLSSALLEEISVSGTRGSRLRHIHCEMALDGRGASWLQEDSGIRNPYYGSAMLECGTLRQALDPSP